MNGSAFSGIACSEVEWPKHDRGIFQMKTIAVAFLMLVTLCAAMVSYALEALGIPPRRLAPYIEQRTAGGDEGVIAIGHWMSKTLLAADRGSAQQFQPLQPLHMRIGAQPEPATRRAQVPKRKVAVGSTTAAIAAIADARPGDEITFAPGHYRFTGSYVDVSRAGIEGLPITLRAAMPETVFLDFDMTEGFLVSAPYWTFENLAITGACNDHSNCEHAFHITGNASHFIARNNTIIDFNAHFKINGSDGQMPDDGLIEANTLTNKSIRHTGNPVTIIDLVAASNWTIRKNFIADFIKESGNQISYGGFAKGAGSQNVFENNIVFCEYALTGQAGQRVGLSFGDGGTGVQYCRDKRCITEQDGSAIRGNLIAACSDDGIYLNSAATSKITHNTIIDTGGVSVRYPQSSADVEGNLVDGRIREREGAIVRSIDNLDTATTRLYLGSHPVRELFVEAGNHLFKGQMPRRAKTDDAGAVPDLCGASQEGPRPYGAFHDFADCFR
jgi:hypothetical protein